MDDEGNSKEGEADENRDRVANEDEQRAKSAWKRCRVVGVERPWKGESGKHGVGELGGLEKRVVFKEVAFDGGEIGYCIRSGEQIYQTV